MPTSKQVRARQNRQRERIAVAHAERAQKHKRNLVVGWTGAVLVVVLGVAALILFLPSDKSTPVTAPPTTAATTPTTVKALASAAGKPCVATKGPLPNGAPAVPVQVGPAPKTLVIKDLKTGTGAVIAKGQTVTTNYIGVACSTGAVFDSSYKTGTPTPVPFPLKYPGGVIQGFADGMPGMKVGGVRLIGIPAAQAYGANPPAGAGIAPDEALWFVVSPTKIG